MKREDPTIVTAWWAAMTFLITAITLVAVLVIGADNRENQSQYERGMYDGAHDLCQEVGGTWRNGQDGWCDMPESR